MTDSIVMKALKRLSGRGSKTALFALICALFTFVWPMFENGFSSVSAQKKNSTVFEFMFSPSGVSFFERGKLISDFLPLADYSFGTTELPVAFEFRMIPKNFILELELRGRFMSKGYAGTLIEEKSFDKGGGYCFVMTAGWRKLLEKTDGLSFTPLISYSQQGRRYFMSATNYKVSQKTPEIGAEIRFTDDKFGVFFRTNYGRSWERADIDGDSFSVLYEYNHVLNMVHIKFGGEIRVKDGMKIFLEVDNAEPIVNIGKVRKIDGSFAEYLVGIKLKLPSGKTGPQ